MVSKGIYHLTTDNMIYDCLREAQKEDEILQAFVIKYVDKKFADQNYSQEKNQIYVVRRTSVISKRGYDFQEFDVDIDLYILLKEYDNVIAQRIIKTMYRNIMHHLVNDPVGAYLKVESFRYEYKQNGVLESGVITFSAHEVEDFEYDYDETPIKIALGLDVSIMGQNKHHIPYHPKPLKGKGKKLKPTKYKPRITVPDQTWYKDQLGKLQAKVTFGDEPVRFGELIFEYKRSNKYKELTRATIKNGEVEIEDLIIPDEIQEGTERIKVTYPENDVYQESTTKSEITIKEIKN